MTSVQQRLGNRCGDLDDLLPTRATRKSRDTTWERTKCNMMCYTWSQTLRKQDLLTGKVSGEFNVAGWTVLPEVLRPVQH